MFQVGVKLHVMLMSPYRDVPDFDKAARSHIPWPWRLDLEERQKIGRT